MSHVDDGMLHAYLDGELSALEVTRVEAHVAECAPCRARLDEERDVLARASRILALAEPPEPVAPPLHTLRHRRLGWRMRWPPLAWAATLVLAIGIGWFVRGGLTGGDEVSETAPFRATQETALADTPVPAPVLAQREEPAAEPAPPQTPPAAAPSVAAQRPDSLPTTLARATPDTTTRQVALAETMRDSAARQDTAVRIAQEAAAVFGERAARRAVTLDAVLITDTLKLDQARALVDGDVYAVSGLPIRSVMRGRLIGYASVVVVEQPLDSSTVIRVETRRPASVALDAVAVGAAQAERARADTVAANFQRRGQVRAPAGPALARRVAGLEIHITGPVPSDSLRKLLEKAAPIR